MDHDRLFKELLRTFFLEFIALFFPELAAYTTADPPEFLDKEVFTDLASADCHEVDLLAKVRIRGGGDAFFLVHIENQASPQSDFANRV